jgi:hypothetical protein
LLEVALPAPGAYQVNKDRLFALTSVGKTDLNRYADRGEPQTRLRDMLHRAQLLLWATTPMTPPRALQAEVAQLKREFRGSMLLIDRIPIPTTPQADKQLKERVLASCKQLARIIANLETLADELQEARPLRDKENLRWQAHYDLILAWVQHRIVYLEELNLALGGLRKELPAYDAAVHKTYRLDTREVLRDVPSRKRYREAEKVLQQVAKDHPDTIWAELAQQAMKMHLSVEWQAVK